MQKIFIEKYKDDDIKEEIFRMNQREDESLEDLIERFMYNVKRGKLHHLGSVDASKIAATTLGITTRSGP